jgi:tRNA G10  N-methylase Trm11
MLPPKLAQIMINLAVGDVDKGVILDPFCGTGVVLQEAALMGFDIYGTDIDSRMIEYSGKNLDWLSRVRDLQLTTSNFQLTIGDATDFKWKQPIDFVVTETYLGRPYASEPSMEKLNENMNTCNLIDT